VFTRPPQPPSPGEDFGGFAKDELCKKLERRLHQTHQTQNKKPKKLAGIFKLKLDEPHSSKSLFHPSNGMWHSRLLGSRSAAWRALLPLIF
jgi:hypothetical protein